MIRIDLMRCVVALLPAIWLSAAVAQGGRVENEFVARIATVPISPAERATVTTELLDLDGVAELLVQSYDSLDAEGRALVPLVRIYWPAT